MTPTLPANPRRRWLISFWLAISLLSGLLLGLMFALVIAPAWSALGAVAAIVIAWPGLRRPDSVSTAYRSWNTAAHEYCRIACVVLTGICFCTVVVPAALSGSTLPLARPPAGGTSWIRRTPDDHAHDPFAPRSARESWLATYLSWTVRSGHVWAISLLPFLIMLELFEPGRERETPAGIYTLF